MESLPFHRFIQGIGNNRIHGIYDSGFHPTASNDVVLQLSSRVSENFNGAAGVIFQQVGTLQKDCRFVTPFDMLGSSFADKGSSITGVNDALCYLALSWMPVKGQPLHVDAQTLHTYEIRLHGMTQTEWLGIVKVEIQNNVRAEDCHELISCSFILQTFSAMGCKTL